MPPMGLFLASAVLFAVLAAAGTANGLSLDDLKAQLDAAINAASAEAYTSTAMANVKSKILPQIPRKHYVLIWDDDLGIADIHLWYPAPHPFVEWINSIFPARAVYKNPASGAPINYAAIVLSYGFIDKCDVASTGSNVWLFTWDTDTVCKDKSGNIVDCNSSNRCRVEWACKTNSCTPPESASPDPGGP